MKMVLASKNTHKLMEMKAILGQLGVEVVLESDVGVDVDVEETGETFEEDAALKARAVMEATGLPAIADDSGLCVAALGGGAGGLLRPLRRRGAHRRGPLSAGAGRPAGRAGPEREVRLLHLLRISRRGHDHGPGGVPRRALPTPPGGEEGFGYDPVFFLPEYKKTFAQMTAEEKNAVSHRGRALAKFKTELENYLHGTDQ